MGRVSRVIGHVWVVRWSSPYTNPPEGMARELLRVEVPCRSGAGAGKRPAEIEALLRTLVGLPGYGCACGGLYAPTVRKSPEQLAKIRLGHLERRMRRKHPLFAEQYIAEAIAAKPGYYAGLEHRPEARVA